MYAGGAGGLIGNTIQPQTGLMGYAQPQLQSLQQNANQNASAPQGGYWSQLAYQMAGRPQQGPYASVATPPAPPGSTSSSSSGGSSAAGYGAAALGLLGALSQSPKGGGTSPLGSAVSSLGSKLGGLLGTNGNPFGTYTSANIGNVGNVAGSGITNSYAPATAQYTSGLMGSAANAAGVSGIAPVGTGAIDAAASAGATAAIPGLEAGGEAAGGLLGGGAAAASSPALEAVGTGAIDAAADAGVAEGAAATGGAEAGSAGMGALAGGAAGLGIALAPALIGMSTPAVQLTGKYWGGVQNSLQQAIASGDRGQMAQQVMGLLSQPQSQIPANIQQLVYSTGFVPSSGWGTGYDPAKTAAVIQQAGGLKGGNSGGGAISVNRA